MASNVFTIYPVIEHQISRLEENAYTPYFQGPEKV
jgi:hypothetical protein